MRSIHYDQAKVENVLHFVVSIPRALLTEEEAEVVRRSGAFSRTVFSRLSFSRILLFYSFAFVCYNQYLRFSTSVTRQVIQCSSAGPIMSLNEYQIVL